MAEDLAVIATRAAVVRLPRAFSDVVFEECVAGERPAVRQAAVMALGEVGRAADVPRLRAAVDAYPLDRNLGRAAQAAISAIQARLEGAEPGQISLAEETGAGQLSLATDDRTGQVTLADQDRVGNHRFVDEND